MSNPNPKKKLTTRGESLDAAPPDDDVDAIFDENADNLRRAADACRTRGGGAACVILDVAADVLRHAPRVRPRGPSCPVKKAGDLEPDGGGQEAEDGSLSSPTGDAPIAAPSTARDAGAGE